MASAEDLHNAFARIALLEDQVRQYKEVAAKSTSRVVDKDQPDDAQA